MSIFQSIRDFIDEVKKELEKMEEEEKNNKQQMKV
jgi:hypothetical protein